MADRITRPGVGAVADDQQLGRESAEPVERLCQRGFVRRPVGPARERQIEDVTRALVGMAPEKRIIDRRVGVDRGEGDVLSPRENVLRSIAVMIVDIEDRNARSARGERGLGGDRGSVEIGIATEIIAPGMVPRRASQREGVALPIDEHCVERGERGLRAPVAGFPCSCADRSRRVEAVLPEPRVDPGEVECAPPDDRKAVGKRVAAPPGGKPFVVGGPEQVDIVGIVNRKDRFDPMIARGLGRSDRFEDRVDPARMLGRRMKRAVEEFGHRAMKPLTLVPERTHQRIPIGGA